MKAPQTRKHNRPAGAVFVTSALAILMSILLLAGPASAGEGGGGGANIAMFVFFGGLGLGGLGFVMMHGKPSTAKQWKPVFAIGAAVAVVSGVFWAVAAVGSTTGEPTAAATTDNALSSLEGSFADTIDFSGYVRDFHTGAAIASADVWLYENASGYSIEQIYTRSVASVFSCTTDSTGKCSLSGLPAKVYDLCASKSGYYTAFEACRFGVTDFTTKVVSPLASDQTPEVTVTGLNLRAHGTLDLTGKTSSTISSSGCSAGTSTCPLGIFFGNDEADSSIVYPAVKIKPKAGTDTTATNLTFASLQSGSPCSYAVINQEYYVYDKAVDVLKPKQWANCGVNMNFASGSANGKVNLTLDDGFKLRMYESMATRPGGIPAGDFETNANWNDLDPAMMDVTR